MESRAYLGRAAGGSCCLNKCERKTVDIMRNMTLEGKQRKLPEKEPREEKENEATGTKGVENSRREKSAVSTASQR